MMLDKILLVTGFPKPEKYFLGVKKERERECKNRWHLAEGSKLCSFHISLKYVETAQPSV